jgi:hypothetical protein
MISDKDFEKFIGKKSYYYLMKWESPISFNFAAALFGPVWFMYRKMYLIGFIYYLLNFVMVISLYIYVPQHLFLIVLPIYNFFLFILFGSLSNLIYKILVSSSISYMNKNYSGEYLTEKFKSYGGTDLSFACGFLVFNFWLVIFAILFAFTFIYEDFMNFMFSIEDNI